MSSWSTVIAVIVIGAVTVVQASAQTTLNWPVGENRAYSVNSGNQTPTTEDPAVVFEHVVQVDGALWLRLFFGDVTLGPGSYVRLTAELDGEVQELDAAALRMWDNSSAYFNGNTVVVELIAAPGTQNALEIVELATQIDQDQAERQQAGGSGQCGICGSDDRRPSTELWTARLLPLGCTASIYNESSCMVTAGHCVDGSNGDVVQFNVPDSLSNCQLVNPPVADQFPIIIKSYVNGGVGNDWAALKAGTNNLGQTPFERYGQLRELASTPGTVGALCDLFGYGVDLTCILTQTQQHDDGPITAVFDTYYEFSIDVRGGNSGSALLRSSDQTILGVVTHCPCPNTATRIDLPAFVSGREFVCCSVGDGQELSNCCSANGTPGCDDATCETIVCNVDPFCCDVSWDSICAGEAYDLCGDLCVGDGGNCDDGDVCNGAEACIDGQCQPGPPANCDDLDLCTIDSCDPVDGCQNDPVQCPDGETCDPSNGLCETVCPGDFDGDGSIGTPDLLQLLASWGDCPGCPQDLDGNGAVDTLDLLEFLASWGPCE